MKLSHTYTSSLCFVFDDVEDFVIAAELTSELEKTAKELVALALPPVLDRSSLGVLLGMHRGLIWSFVKRTPKHYRTFPMRKGTKVRTISTPRVGLKIIQKWLSVHLGTKYEPPSHVFGFVQGLSHLDAAKVHLNCDWVISVDIENFFDNISAKRVNWAFKRIGYPPNSAQLLTSLVCLDGALPQGSPCSPVLSNLCAFKLDRRLKNIAKRNSCNVSRYADDIVFSGKGALPESLLPEIKNAVTKEGWSVSGHKTSVAVRPSRLKVHGLLVQGDKLRLTKGYRNRLRAYQHLVDGRKVRPDDAARIIGHLNYAKSIEAFNARED